MRREIHRLCWYLVVLFAFTACSNSRKAAHGAIVRISPVKIYLGDVEQFSAISHSFTLRNESDGTIEIQQLIGSCACTWASASRTLVKPGESADINVNINAGSRTGRFGVHVDVPWKSVNSDERGVVTLSASARAVSLVSLFPQSVDLGVVPRQAKPVPFQIVVRHANAKVPWDDISIEAAPPISVNVMKMPDGSFDLLGSLNPASLPIGLFRGIMDLKLRYNLTNLKSHFQIPVNAVVKSNLNVVPNTLYFGVKKPGDKSSGDFEISSSIQPELLSIYSSDDQILRARLQASKGNTLMFHFNLNAPQTTGVMSGHLRIIIKNPEPQNIDLPFLGYVDSR